MKHSYLLILLAFLIQCKSPKSDETIDVENKKRLDEWYANQLQEKKERTLKYEKQMAKFDTLYEFIDSTVFVKGIVQSSGIRDTIGLGFYTEFLLTNPKKQFFLVTKKDISNYWGKCVTVSGKYLKDWNYESPDYFGVTAIVLDSIRSISNNYCFSSPVFRPVNENKFEKHFRDSLFEGYIYRMKRPCPDISYDYGFELTKPVDLKHDEWNNIKSLPLSINIKLDTLNFIIDNKKKVKLYGIITGGYAEGIIFNCKEYQGYE